MSISAAFRFSGTSPISLDPQKRLAIPARYREEINTNSSNKLYATKGIQHKFPYLTLYPLPRWEALHDQIMGLKSNNPGVAKMRHLVIGSAEPIELDSNSRILIPKLLREFASINGKAVLVGQGSSFELWSEDHYASFQEDLNDFDITSIQELDDAQSIGLA